VDSRQKHTNIHESITSADSYNYIPIHVTGHELTSIFGNWDRWDRIDV